MAWWSSASASRDNWERLVAAVLKKEQIWDLCHRNSFSTIASDYSDGILSFSNNSSRPVSSFPSPQFPLTNDSVVEDRENASKTITLKRFFLDQLLVATDDFSHRNVIGHGRHSTVYKGRLVDGSLVAVKKLRQRVIEIELEMANLVKHRNIIKLIGFCITQKEQLLVYPYMANGSVASCLRERYEWQPPLKWPVRKTIALGVAKGLSYLNQECTRRIIHRDVKAANILLDENFEAFVADFTLAKFMDCDDDDGVVGTLSHIAPEYLSTGKCTEKTDVFSYGVFLLELITGKQISHLPQLACIDSMKLLDLVSELCEEKKFEVMIDPDLRGNYVEEEVEKLMRMALICTWSDPDARPTMLKFVRMFEDSTKNASGPITRKLFSASLWRRKPKDYSLGQRLVGIPEDHFGLETFSLRELLVATDNFGNNNVLGYDGLGEVYKGRLADGSLVQVTRLQQEIEINLEITSIAAHCNVLRARGFCFTQKEKLLVYPFMVNKSVAFWLRERHEPLHPLDWPTRKHISLGAAKGLAYLHYECPRKIIHHDVRAANILLDENFEAVVADLTLGKFVDCCDNDIATPVRGTIGHIAPEYVATGKCSVKIDVFGYGIFLLELITAQRAFDRARLASNNDVMLLDWVNEICNEREWKLMVDAEIQCDFIDEEVEELLQIALMCAQIDPEQRPTMLEVVRMLEVAYGLAETEAEWFMDDFEGDTLERQYVEDFALDKLQAATEDFSDKIISEHGFNIVYKGLLDGSPVAVKRYKSQSLEYYFAKELEIGTTCFHPNLVRVIGFCRTPEERLLVFRLMVNGSVESWLRGRHVLLPPLTWQKRKRIALGAARGLAYLHDKCEKKIIHRNVKAANILLDHNFDAVVADFKSATFMDHNMTHITTTVAGTIGHIAPEYLASGRCSDKTDVFGYGAFLLELITGHRAIDLLHVTDEKNRMRADWVKKNYEEGRWKSMVDKDSGGGDSMDAVVVKQLVKIAVLCTQYDPDRRPRMSHVVSMLKFGCGVAERSDQRFEEVVGEEEYDGSSSLVSEELSDPR